jgi:hypothetical protein
MKTGVSIREDEHTWRLMCDKCRGGFIFPIRVERQEAIEILKRKDNWVKEGNQVFCEACSGKLVPKKSKKSKPEAPKISTEAPPKSESKSAKNSEDNQRFECNNADDIIELV